MRKALAILLAGLLGCIDASALSLQDCQQNQKGYANASEHEMQMPPDAIGSIVKGAMDAIGQSTNQVALAQRAQSEPVYDPKDPYPWTSDTYTHLEGCFAAARLVELRSLAPAPGHSPAAETQTPDSPGDELQAALGDWAPVAPAAATGVGRSAAVISGESRKPVQELTHCLRAESFGQGKQCGDPTSYSVRVTNTCSATIEAEVCFKRLDGTANCGRESDLAPGQSQAFWGCQLTKTYKYLGCEHWKTRNSACSMMKANGPFIED